MARTICFHLDEQCDPAIATGLRLHRVDVTTTPETGLLGARDEEHIAYAFRTSRVIYTQDDDFLRLNAKGLTTEALCSQLNRPAALGRSSRASYLSGRFMNPKKW